MSTLTFSLVQADLFWEDKAANLQQLEAMINSIKEPTEVVVLPEMFSTGFSMRPGALAEKMDGPTVSWMKKTSKEKGVVLTGSLIIEEEGNYYNRLIWMLPNGHYGTYDKRHLFAYGKEHEHFSAGNKRLIASVKGWKINLFVCYDLRFPVWARQQINEAPEYDVLVYVANWPQRRSLAWKTLLQARAIENQCYTIGVNRVGMDGKGIEHNGDTTVTGPLGETVLHAEKTAGVYTVTLEKKTLDETRATFPFWKDADAFRIGEI